MTEAQAHSQEGPMCPRKGSSRGQGGIQQPGHPETPSYGDWPLGPQSCWAVPTLPGSATWWMTFLPPWDLPTPLHGSGAFSFRLLATGGRVFLLTTHYHPTYIYYLFGYVSFCQDRKLQKKKIIRKSTVMSISNKNIA